jgi:hypothetical protein
MSFILDALKKLERQKQKDRDASGEDAIIMEGGRRWGETRRRLTVGWGGITLAVAALIVATIALYQSGSVEAPAPTDSEPVELSTQAETGEVDSPPHASPPTAVGGELGSEDRTPDRVLVPPEQAQTAPLEETEPEESEPSPDEEIETAPPVRLVGSGTRDSTRPEPGEPSEGVSREIPEGLPELVLQGTSVVDGKPIAVINYQRLFEGDVIEGARIVEIGDRVVELEFQGKRFVIEL